MDVRAAGQGLNEVERLNLREAVGTYLAKLRLAEWRTARVVKVSDRALS